VESVRQEAGPESQPSSKILSTSLSYFKIRLLEKVVYTDLRIVKLEGIIGRCILTFCTAHAIRFTN